GVDLGLFAWCNCPQRESANRSAAAHQLTRIYCNLPTASDHNHTTILGQEFRVGRQIHVGEHFQNDVCASIGRSFADFFLISGVAVIKGAMCALAPDQLHTLRRPSSANNVQALCTCDLERCDADTSTCAMHQKG